MPSPLMRCLRIASGLAASAFAIACGGSAGSRPPAAATAPAPGTRLALGAGKISWSAPGHYSMEAVLHADGNLDLSATFRDRQDGPDQTARMSGKLTASGELAIDGRVVARVGEDGAVTVLHRSEVYEAGVLVNSEATWQDIGVLDERGVFTSRKDGRKVSVGADGTLAGVPGGMTIKVDVGGTPARNRTAVFVIVASFAAGKQVTTSEGPSKQDEKPAEPAPPPADTPSTPPADPPKR